MGRRRTGDAGGDRGGAALGHLIAVAGVLVALPGGLLAWQSLAGGTDGPPPTTPPSTLPSTSPSTAPLGSGTTPGTSGSGTTPAPGDRAPDPVDVLDGTWLDEFGTGLVMAQDGATVAITVVEGGLTYGTGEGTFDGERLVADLWVEGAPLHLDLQLVASGMLTGALESMGFAETTTLTRVG